MFVFGGLAAGVGYGISAADRTDVPGLATEHDGRWDYPRLERPALPAGVPGPYDKGNEAGTHHADLRELLLPVPESGEPDPAAPAAEDGWLDPEDFLREYAEEEDRVEIRRQLTENSCRHIATRSWIMPDGTRTRIHLLQFNTAAMAVEAQRSLLGGDVAPEVTTPVTGTEASDSDSGWAHRVKVEDIVLDVYDERKPRGERHVRHGYFVSGDTIAMIVQSREGYTPAVPFRQTVVLQTQLLS
ncbi:MULTISPECIES: hypothetical protein [Streptomyces]|uniref:Tat pathway signal sequence domain protein n=1 Tax=Streptomyces lycii TaxID=2654337 RepID=A0ABQ7FGN2_9ACTN|nr:MULTISPECIES: hypothetical protein [Streptomyces]KAF4407113.1 hypothetical protein GCU69_21215 [Streptomyces lycii]PGH49173.1 hypothetical protein CRI70_19155 [Streptomyces sp. Ru87]